MLTWIELPQNRSQWWVYLETGIMNLRVL